MSHLEQYSKDPASFEPEHTDRWTYGVEQDGWVYAHNGLRGEVQHLQDMLQAVRIASASKQTTVSSSVWVNVKAAWTYHKDHVLRHVQAEQDVLRPFLETRFQWPEENIKNVESIRSKVKTVDEAMQGLSSETISSVEACFKDYATILTSYMKHNEEHTLVVMRAYFTPQEVGPIGNQTGKQAGAAGSFVHYNGGADTFRNTFMVQHNMPWYVWYLAYMWPLKRFEDTFLAQVKHVMAATAGSEDATESSAINTTPPSSVGVKTN